MKPYRTIEKYFVGFPTDQPESARSSPLEAKDVVELQDIFAPLGQRLGAVSAKSRVYGKVVGEMESLEFSVYDVDVRIWYRKNVHTPGLEIEVNYDPSSKPLARKVADSTTSMFIEKSDRLSGKFNVTVRTIADPVKMRVREHE